MACSGRPLPFDIIRAIRRMAAAGVSYRTIAATLRISTYTVWKVLRSLQSNAPPK
jgi:DNA invertase Pin-like site-specific DNA recombinase